MARFRNIMGSFKHRASDAWLTMHRQVLRHEVIQVGTEALSQDDIIIALVGPTGAGKSNFISNATGINVGIGHNLESHTKEVRNLRSQYMERSDLDVVFVDTPGFDDTYKSDREIFSMIIDWLKKTYKRDVKLSGILYFHRISDNRLSGTPLTNLDMFKTLCGEHALQNIVFITTMWDHPGFEEKVAIKRERQLVEQHWGAMIEEGSKVARYHNTWDSAWDIIDHFLEQANERCAARLQAEMVEIEKQLSKTMVGRELYARLEVLFKKQQEMLKNIRAAIKRHRDQSRLNNLRVEYEDLREQLRSTIASIQNLEVPIGSGLLRRFETQLGFRTHTRHQP